MTPEHQAQHETWKAARSNIEAAGIISEQPKPKPTNNIIELVPTLVDPKREMMDFIVAAVGNVAELPVNQILAGPGTREFVAARKLAMALCVRRLKLDGRTVADYFEVVPAAVTEAAFTLDPILIAGAVSNKTPLELVLPSIWGPWQGKMNEATAKEPTVAYIQQIICDVWGVTKKDLLSHRREKRLMVPRQIGMALSRWLTSRSLPDIGRRFGGRDHTTVLHAAKKYQSIIDVLDGVLPADSTISEWAFAIKTRLSR